MTPGRFAIAILVLVTLGETDAAYSPDGKFVASLAHARDRLLVFDVRRGGVKSLADGGGVYGLLMYSPDGTLVASLGDDPAISPDGKGVAAFRFPARRAFP